MTAETTPVNPAPCSPACETAVRRLSDEVLPLILAVGLDRSPGIDAAESELNLSGHGARSRRWRVAGLVAALGGLTPEQMAGRIEAQAGGGDAVAGCRALAETLQGGGGVAGLVLKGASEPCCTFAFGAEAAAYWRTVAERLSVRATQRVLKEKASRIKRL